MVPILSSSEKPMTNGNSTLAFFRFRLMFLEDRRATDITLDGHDLVLPGTVKMILIIPKGGLKGISFRDSEFAWLPWPLEWCSNCFNFSLSDELVQMIPQTHTILCGIPMILMIQTIEVMVTLFRVSYHLIWSFKEWFIFYLLQYLMHWLSEHCTDNLSIVWP